MSFRLGRVIKIMLRTSTSGNGPERNGNIFVTFLSLRNAYFVTKPTGPESESSQTIAFYSQQNTQLLIDSFKKKMTHSNVTNLGAFTFVQNLQ